jgi:hypothetical protein
MICEQVLQRPIIVLDGIDDHDGAKNPKDDRTEIKLYEQYLYYLNPQNNLDTLSIGDSLRMMGYDLVIFNPVTFQDGNLLIDGGDLQIEANGYALVKLIQDINDSLAINNPNGKICIAGPSMGGQISRFALDYMEAQDLLAIPKMKHNCRLWCAFDSPNLGASIPIAVQQYIKFFGERVGSAGAHLTFQNNLMSPASQQLLINQAFHNDKKIANVRLNNSGNKRNLWMNKINAMGYPTICRNIALSNGSSQGGYFHSPQKTIFDFETLNMNQTWIGLGLHVYGKANCNFMPEVGNNCQTFKGKAVFMLNFLPVWIMKSKSSSTNNCIFGSLEGGPGSIYDIQQSIYDEATNSISANW